MQVARSCLAKLSIALELAITSLLGLYAGVWHGEMEGHLECSPCSIFIVQNTTKLLSNLVVIGYIHY